MAQLAKKMRQSELELEETRDVLGERSAGPGAALEVDKVMALLKEMTGQSERKLEETILRREVLWLGRSAARLILPSTEAEIRMAQLAVKMKRSELELEETRLRRERSAVLGGLG